MLSALKALFAAGLMAFLPFSTMAADKFETLLIRPVVSLFISMLGAARRRLMPILPGQRSAESRNDITLIHVKLTDTADAVSRILAEKTAGKTSGGSVDSGLGKWREFCLAETPELASG